LFSLSKGNHLLWGGPHFSNHNAYKGFAFYILLILKKPPAFRLCENYFIFHANSTLAGDRQYFSFSASLRTLPLKSHYHIKTLTPPQTYFSYKKTIFQIAPI